MKKITFIGDVHGKITQLIEIMKLQPDSQFFCVGDVGFERTIMLLERAIPIDQSYRFFSVMGNHDWLPGKDNWPYFEDFKFIQQLSMFAVRGADSIDKHLRTEGVDWFANEELTYAEGLECLNLYEKCQPKIVVSHDCPQSVMTSLFGYPEKSRTRQLLEAMFEIHKPNLWVFGHHHKSKDVDILGTRFVCLAELETLTIEI